MARKIGLPPEQVFKTLVARGDRTGVLLAVVPGDAELDLKALARVSGDRKVDVVPLQEVQPLTGYVRGGVTALGGKKDYPVFVDETIELFDVISVSAGARGTADPARAGRLSARRPRQGGGDLQAEGVVVYWQGCMCSLRPGRHPPCPIPIPPAPSPPPT